MKTIMVIMLHLFAGVLWAQDLKQDAIRLNEQYSCAQSISQISKYKYYDNIKKRNIPDKVFNGKFIKQGSNYFMQSDQNFQVKIENVAISVYKQDKTISVALAKDYNHNYLLKDINEALKYITNYSFSDSIPGVKYYKLYYNEKMPFYRIDIAINTSTFLISNYIGYAIEEVDQVDGNGNTQTEIKHTKLEIEYYNNPQQASTLQNIFNIESYIIIEGNKIKPASKYADYEIINLKI